MYKGIQLKLNRIRENKPALFLQSGKNDSPMWVNHGNQAFLPTHFLIFILLVIRLNALLADTNAEDEKKREKMKKWKDRRDKLNSKYKKTRGKFNKVKGQGIPNEPKKVQEQLEHTRVSYMNSH